ncbi:MAG: hypothetical protein FWF47_02860 [Clostridia bacterium]|nr:hypothetical protein [Clostridia bacterium]
MQAAALLTAVVLLFAAPLLLVTGNDLTAAETTIQVPELPRDLYGFLTGTVTNVSVDDAFLLTAESEQSGQFVFSIEAHTYVPVGFVPEVGSDLWCFYDMGAIMPAIYPPLYRAVAVLPVRDDAIAYLGVFNEEGISLDGTLLIKPDEEMRVQDVNGDAYTGDLANKLLLVTYSVSTRSIPAITTPESVIILDQSIVE